MLEEYGEIDKSLDSRLHNLLQTMGQKHGCELILQADDPSKLLLEPKLPKKTYFPNSFKDSALIEMNFHDDSLPENEINPKHNYTDISIIAETKEVSSEGKGDLVEELPTELPLGVPLEEETFEELLDASSRALIKSLRSKISSLNQALSDSQKDCSQLVRENREMSQKCLNLESCKQQCIKRLNTSQKQLNKNEEATQILNDRVKLLEMECKQMKREQLATNGEKSRRELTLNSFESQLSRIRTENSSIRGQLVSERSRHKDEMEKLKSELLSSQNRCHDLEQRQKLLTTLNKKQERLIQVMTQQKNNITLAKSTKCLEDKFLKAISTLDIVEKPSV